MQYSDGKGAIFGIVFAKLNTNNSFTNPGYGFVKNIHPLQIIPDMVLPTGSSVFLMIV